MKSFNEIYLESYYEFGKTTDYINKKINDVTGRKLIKNGVKLDDEKWIKGKNNCIKQKKNIENSKVIYWMFNKRFDGNKRVINKYISWLTILCKLKAEYYGAKKNIDYLIKNVRLCGKNNKCVLMVNNKINYLNKNLKSLVSEINTSQKNIDKFDKSFKDGMI